MSYSHMGTPTLPSALTHFTTEFGMGSGGAMSLLSLDKKVTILKAFSITYYYIIDDINTLSLIHHYVMRDVCQTYLQNHLGVVWLSLTGN